jgi:hypothetical protein
METYDKVMALNVDDVTMTVCTPAELRKAGKVLIVQAMVKEGYKVDGLTRFNVSVKTGGLEIRARRK